MIIGVVMDHSGKSRMSAGPKDYLTTGWELVKADFEFKVTETLTATHLLVFFMDRVSVMKLNADATVVNGDTLTIHYHRT